VTDRYRVAANLATLANGLVGAGSILYVLAGNKLWAMLLIVCGIGFDGLDGLFSRRSPIPSGALGRVADSAADAITFGVAPAALVAVHTDHAAAWAPFAPYCLAVALVVAALAVGRLLYFTLRGFHWTHFVGAPTPQAALAIVLLGLFFDRPAFWGTDPAALLVGALGVSLLMVAPVPFPKVRRGSPIRPIAAVTALALVGALLPLQFGPATGSALFLLALAATIVAAVGNVLYFVAGPWIVVRQRTGAP